MQKLASKGKLAVVISDDSLAFGVNMPFRTCIFCGEVRLSMHVCMYECTYVCMYVCMCVLYEIYVCVCMYVRIFFICERVFFKFVFVYVCIYVCIYVCMYVCMYVCVYVFDKCACILVVTNMWPYIHLDGIR